MTGEKLQTESFDSTTNATEKIEQVREMLVWRENPKIMRKGLEKALVLTPLYPEEVLESIGCEIGEAVELLRDTQYRNRVERTLGNVAKNHPGSIDKEALKEMNSSSSWYTRWLSVWIMNNMAHESPELVPLELLDSSLKDEDKRVRDFAQRLQNRIERLRVAEL